MMGQWWPWMPGQRPGYVDNGTGDTSMTVGSVVFGPKVSPAERRYWDNLLQQSGSAIGSNAPNATACNCTGPQPGETKCPCALMREAEMGRKMVDEGVTVNGKRYRLVPE